jgi:multiple sugar transport system substrate-binding protein
MRGRTIAALCCTLGAALTLGACGDDGGGGSGGTSAGDAAAVKGKAIDVKSMDSPPKGTVTWCAGKDTTGGYKVEIDKFNKQFASAGYKARLVEFPASADEQRTQFVQRQEGKSSECDVFQSDVVWTAEFAGQNWLYDMTPYVKARASDIIPSTLETATYGGRIWAMPFLTNTTFLYYRTDQVKQPPTTWQALYKDAGQRDGIVYQGAAYEGLTCSFLDLAFAAGGDVLSKDGKHSVIDSPENLKALKLMVSSVKDGDAPKAVTTYMEEEARQAVEAGKATYMRNWVYAYALAEKAPKTKGKFGVTPLPAFEGGGKAGVLGGGNLVISRYSKNPGLALKFVDYMTTPEIQADLTAKFANVPVLSATFDDPKVKAAMPFAAELRTAIEQAHSRPQSPVYPQISEAIYKNVNAALSGSKSPEDALSAAQSQIETALKSF